MTEQEKDEVEQFLGAGEGRKQNSYGIQGAVGARLSDDDVDIQVKSKQNYRAEWGTAAFRAKVSKNV